MKPLLHALILPPEISAFERQYLQRVNRFGLLFFGLHVPVFAVIAFFNRTDALQASLLTSLVLLGPAAAYATLGNPRTVSLVYGFAAMLMGGLLVHIGQGPLQIEMHFYFFALLAMLAVFGNPLVVAVAALTVALHHLLLWAWLPASVFNYDAPIWVVAVHALFVVLESVASCFIARSFFDNVIGLERIVQARTRALDARNQDLRLVLDNVEQGFITIDREAMMSEERSSIVETWLGAAAPQERFDDYLARSVPELGASFKLAFEQLLDDVLPLDLLLAQMPSHFRLNEHHYRLVYRPVALEGQLSKLVVVISDVTADVANQRLEAEQREAFRIFECVMRDKAGFLQFFEEAGSQVTCLSQGDFEDLATARRLIHTLKGNAAMFGILTVSEFCHRLETEIAERNGPPSPASVQELRDRWQRVRQGLDSLLGDRSRNRHSIEIDDLEYESILKAVLEGEPAAEVAQRIEAWKLEPAERSLTRAADHAQSIANRLHRGPLQIIIEHDGLRLDAKLWAPFWASFGHAVRNAVDHGFEPADERRQQGKPAQGRLSLSTRLDAGEFVIAIEDDGRGVDWDSVGKRAAEHGLPHTTSPELEAALFCEGISTARQLSDISGRGVGLYAIREACSAFGGRTILRSERGRGTRLEFRFPSSRLSDRVPRLAA